MTNDTERKPKDPGGARLTRAAAAVLLLVAVLASGLAYSRDQEREADRVGIELMARHGYARVEASRMWDLYAIRNQCVSHLQSHRAQSARCGRRKISAFSKGPGAGGEGEPSESGGKAAASGRRGFNEPTGQ